MADIMYPMVHLVKKMPLLDSEGRCIGVAYYSNDWKAKSLHISRLQGCAS